MHPVSYNHSVAVLLTPTRSFLVLFGTGMHWRRIHYFSRLLMPSRTTSSLTCHVITPVFSLITFTRRKRGLPSRCAFVFSHEVALLTEDDEDEDVLRRYDILSTSILAQTVYGLFAPKTFVSSIFRVRKQVKYHCNMS